MTTPHYPFRTSSVRPKELFLSCQDLPPNLLPFNKAKRNLLYLLLKYHLISWPCLVVLVLSLTKFANLCVFWFGWNRTLFLLELNFISAGHYFDPLFRPLPMKDVVSAVREDERRVEKSLALFPFEGW